MKLVPLPGYGMPRYKPSANVPSSIFISNFQVQSFTKISLWTQSQCKPSKEVEDLLAELKKVMKEKGEAVRSQNFKRVIICFMYLLLD
jgi:hypothetical protein